MPGGRNLSLVGHLKADGKPTIAVAREAREEWAKSTIPLARYFDRDGPRRLTLITCDGPFDPATRGYRDNIVITAVPARP